MWHNHGVTETPRRPSRALREPRKAPPPLDADALQRLALHYVGKFATSRGRLVDYLRRKIRERGWDGDEQADLAGIANRFAEMGYVDDRAFAEGRARSLVSQGYGEGRVRQTLRAAGIDEADAAPARDIADEGSWAAALRHAEKKRIGPWARDAPLDLAAARAAVQKGIASLLRAGHDFATARAIAGSRPGETPEDPRG